MSELLNLRRRNIRLELLATASALTLFWSAYSTDQAKAADGDTDRPTVWIELGAQSEQVSGFGDPYSPSFASEIVADGFGSPLEPQRALSQSFGGEGGVSFQPDNSDWSFSASIRYGRANGGKTTHEQTPGGPRHIQVGTATGSATPQHGTAKFSDTRTENSETHVILDFQAGKDIGLGLFNGKGNSTIGFGVRFAQFTSKQVLGITADPDFYFPLDPFHNAKYHHSYTVSSHMDRSFRGLGPSLSWNASAPVIGNKNDGGISLDWGMNAALLFGRQKAQGQHQTTTGFYSYKLQKYDIHSRFHHSVNFDRSRTVLVPNLGGFAGASFNFADAKVSFGYRADFFFGAMDGGIDSARKENRGFYGPFASVSVGIGG